MFDPKAPTMVDGQPVFYVGIKKKVYGIVEPV